MAQPLSHLMWMISIPLLIACDAGSPSDVVPSVPPDTVTVMTYNIFHDSANPARGVLPWSERRGSVVEIIRSRAPDVIGLQEAKVWQVDWLLEEMPEYAAVARGPFADAGIAGAQTVAVLFLKDRFALRDSGHFWYSESPDVPGSHGSVAFGGTPSPRMATWVHLVPRDTPQQNGFYLFNTHFIADRQTDDFSLARLKSAELLVQRIADRAHRDTPVIVTGDLNTPPGSWPLRYLLGTRCESGESCPEPEFRMIDVWAAKHPGDTSGTRCHAASAATGRRLDYVLVLDPRPQTGVPLDIITADIVAWDTGCPSDHLPVAARVVLPKNR